MRATCVGDGQRALQRVVHAKSQRNEARFQPRCVQPPVQHRQHYRRRCGVLDSVFAQHADRQRTIQSGRGSFSGNVAQRQRQTAFAIGKKVVKIATQLSR